ncbi:MAG: hypothetical protein QM793_14755 [Muricomes sp.]
MLKDKFKKTEEPVLDEKTATQMLENIFDACEMEPNSVPLSVLTSYSNYRRERFLLQRLLLIVIMLCFCLVPLLFLTPDITLKMKESNNNGKPACELIVNSLIPISRITATVDGNNVPVYEVGNKTYSIEPTLNGTMTVTVLLKNHQFSSKTIDITGVDTATPTVISDKVVNDQIYLYLSDSDSGVDYEGISAVDIEGEEVLPVSYDDTKNYVIFDYPKKSLNIYIPDKAGNTLHLILTVKP